MYGNQVRAVEWMKRSLAGLEAAELMLSASFPAEAIALSYRAMLMAVKGWLELRKVKWEGEWEIPGIFMKGLSPTLNLTKESQRSLQIVKSLAERVDNGIEEADPLTARACLDDAREFIGEMRDRLYEEMQGEDHSDGGEG